jgi:HD-GYP domain-containing protein (c-di-GMP phosphodiesterase class II)
MVVNYKRELERAAKTMILVHEPELLIKMIIRMIVQKVRVSHASILLRNPDKNSYVLSVSRGPLGVKIPEGFTRMDNDNPLIRIFREHKNNFIFNTDYLVIEEGRKFLDTTADSVLKQLLSSAIYEMEILETTVCIPCYFRDDMLGILLLGDKKENTKLGNDELDFLIALSQDVAMALRNAQLFNQLRDELENKQKLFLHTTIALAAAIDAKDHYTHGHTSRVTNVSLLVAKKYAEKHKNLNDQRFIENVQIASLLHDIGKIGVPESILNKQGPLTDDERKKINEHPMIGVNILTSIHELKDAIQGVKYHHERYDGKGYPEGLKGDAIPLIAAVITIADSYDAMVSDRPYRSGMPKEKAIDEIKRCTGAQFHPEITPLFLELCQEGKI